MDRGVRPTTGACRRPQMTRARGRPGQSRRERGVYFRRGGDYEGRGRNGRGRGAPTGRKAARLAGPGWRVCRCPPTRPANRPEWSTSRMDLEPAALGIIRTAQESSQESRIRKWHTSSQIGRSAPSARGPRRPGHDLSDWCKNGERMRRRIRSTYSRVLARTTARRHHERVGQASWTDRGRRICDMTMKPAEMAPGNRQSSHGTKRRGVGTRMRPSVKARRWASHSDS